MVQKRRQRWWTTYTFFEYIRDPNHKPICAWAPNRTQSERVGLICACENVVNLDEPNPLKRRCHVDIGVNEVKKGTLIYKLEQQFKIQQYKDYIAKLCQYHLENNPTEYETVWRGRNNQGNKITGIEVKDNANVLKWNLCIFEAQITKSNEFPICQEVVDARHDIKTQISFDNKCQSLVCTQFGSDVTSIIMSYVGQPKLSRFAFCTSAAYDPAITTFVHDPNQDKWLLVPDYFFDANNFSYSSSFVSRYCSGKNAIGGSLSIQPTKQSDYLEKYQQTRDELVGHFMLKFAKNGFSSYLRNHKYFSTEPYTSLERKLYYIERSLTKLQSYPKLVVILI
jgi:hypothetical protein